VFMFLVRHGETDWNVENRIQGIYDVPLNERGLTQAKELSRRLEKEALVGVFSSDLSRSYITAVEIAAPHNLEVERDSRLAEVSQGIWEGLLADEARALYPKEYAMWEKDPSSMVPPAGEPVAGAFSRIKEFWAEKGVARTSGDVAIVGHAVINALITCLVEEMLERRCRAAEVSFDGQLRERLVRIWKDLPSNAEISKFELPEDGTN